MNFRKFFKRDEKYTPRFICIQNTYFRKDGKLYIEHQVEKACKGEYIVVRSQYYIIKGEFCYGN